MIGKCGFALPNRTKRLGIGRVFQVEFQQVGRARAVLGAGQFRAVIYVQIERLGSRGGEDGGFTLPVAVGFGQEAPSVLRACVQPPPGVAEQRHVRARFHLRQHHGVPNPGKGGAAGTPERSRAIVRRGMRIDRFFMDHPDCGQRRRRHDGFAGRGVVLAGERFAVHTAPFPAVRGQAVVDAFVRQQLGMTCEAQDHFKQNQRSHRQNSFPPQPSRPPCRVVFGGPVHRGCCGTRWRLSFSATPSSSGSRRCARSHSSTALSTSPLRRYASPR